MWEPRSGVARGGGKDGKLIQNDLLLYFTNNNFTFGFYKKLNNDCCEKSRKMHEKCRLTLYTYKLVTKCRVTLHAICEVRTDHFHRLTADSCSDKIRVASSQSQLSQCNSSKSQILKKTPFLIDINK